MNSVHLAGNACQSSYPVWRWGQCMPLTVLFFLDQEHPWQQTLPASWSGQSKSLCSLHVQHGAEAFLSLCEGCLPLLCHLCSHRCGIHLFMSQESAVTRTLISLHGHVSLSLVGNIAMFNTCLHTETGDSTWFQKEPTDRGGDDKQMMICAYPSGHMTEPPAMLRSLLVT